SGFSDWGACDYVAHAAQMTNSSSPPPPKTSANWPRSFLHRSKPAKPDQKGARAEFRAAISAIANVSFSTKSAGSGHSLRVHPLQRISPKRPFRNKLGAPCFQQFNAVMALIQLFTTAPRASVVKASEILVCSAKVSSAWSMAQKLLMTYVGPA
uniref:hypothetical protein n=1 Tax=Tritonibacter scottomollicae TaxID=483013 RepID=UPI003AA9A8B7